MGRSIIHIMNNSDPGIGPWGTPCFNVPQFREKTLSFRVILPQFFCPVLVKQDLEKSSDTPQIP
jgi:hypothetical protein